MSLQSIAGYIKNYRDDIQRLHTKIADESRKEADLNTRINRNRQSITKTTTESTRNMKENENRRMSDQIAECQKKRADYQKDIARKTEDLHKKEAEYSKEQERLNKKSADESKKQMDQLRRENQTLAQRLNSIPQPQPPQLSSIAQAVAQEPEQFDVFISHAWEDKDWVAPFAEILISRGIKVWYDDHQLQIGDGLRRSIDRGLAAARFGIVVLSPDFFKKGWTNYELDGLVSREQGEGQKIVLPLWHRVTKSEVSSRSPSLADKVALKTADFTLEEIADQIERVVKG